MAKHSPKYKPAAPERRKTRKTPEAAKPWSTRDSAEVKGKKIDRRFAPPIPETPNSPGKIRDPTWGGTKCGARIKHRPGEYCRQQSGFRTDHPGQGKCYQHGGNGHRGRPPGEHKVHPYSQIVHNRLADKWRTLQNLEYDVMDLIPEANLLRALTIDYINRYESFHRALMAWYEDSDSGTKPRRIMDISDAAHLVDGVSKVVERIHKIRSEGSISLETFRRVVEAMGITVSKHVTNLDVLAKIEADWNLIAVDARRPDPAAERPHPHTGQVTNGTSTSHPNLLPDIEAEEWETE